MAESSLHGKVCLITGAASGIGRATAELMAAAGATVVVSDIDFALARTVATSLLTSNERTDAIKLDVRVETEWKAVIEHVMSRYGELDVLVNNAGIARVSPIAECTLDDWRTVMSVNLDGVFLGTKYALEVMKRGSSIVNVASTSGVNPPGGNAASYCTSKAAVRMFSRAVALECADNDSGVRVNVVTPSGVKTPIWETQDFFQSMVKEHGGVDEAFAALEGDMPSQRFFGPEDVARTIVYLSSDAASHLTGTEIILDRGHTG